MREYARSPVGKPIFETKGGGQEGQVALRRLKLTIERYGKFTDNLNTAQILREDTLDLAGGRVLCTVVQAEYTPRPGARGIQSITRTFWIDKQRTLLLQEEMVTKGNLSPTQPFEHLESRSRIRYTHVSTDQPIPDSLFV